MAQVTTDTPPDPAAGWSREATSIRAALVVPPDVSKLVQPCGVFGPGGYVGHGATWRGQRQMMTAPETRPEATARLAGRHLWCGQIWAHFGHFMCESLSRIWALDGQIEGLVFIPKRPGKAEELKAFQREFLALLGIDLPVRVLSEPTEVEELVVPGQGFGLGPIARATPEFRAFFRDRFARDVAPEGGPRLYLSRSALGGQEGGALHEEVLEANLAKAGYEIFHPQQHSLATQIARYRAATHVVGLDGSAFHLFGFVARADQKAAVILRRNSTVYRGLVNQIESFSGRPVDVVDTVVADWIPGKHKRPGRYSFGQLDFARLAAGLQAAGYIPDATGWQVPKFRDVKRTVEDLARKQDTDFIRKKRGAGKEARKAAA